MSSFNDRIGGARASLAFKAPVTVATTANINLTGTQTIDGVAVVGPSVGVIGDRVLVRNQTNAIENGIYDVRVGAWERSKDFDGAGDIVKGSRVYVTDGAQYANESFVVTTANPITIGTTAISFGSPAAGSLAYADLPGYVLLSDYATLTAAVAAIGSTEVTLLVDESQTVSANVTIPSNVVLTKIGAFKLTVASGFAVTVNGHIDVPKTSQIFAFAGTGVVTLPEGDYPGGWFGIHAANADNSAAILSAARSILLGNGGILRLPAGDIVCSSNIALPNLGGTTYLQRALHITGAGAFTDSQGTSTPVGGTILKMSSSSGTAHFATYGVGRLVLDNFTIQATANSALPMLYTTNTTIDVENVCFFGCNTGTAANNDGVVFGGTQAVAPGSFAVHGGDTDASHQGYRSSVRNCYFGRVRRPAYVRVYANALDFSGNFVWVTCGNSSTIGACIEQDGSGGSGMYKRWTTGETIIIGDVRSHLYRRYTATSGGTAANAPTHSAGSATGADTIAWTWNETFVNDIAVSNTFIGNQIEATHYSYITKNTLASFSSFLGNHIFDITGGLLGVHKFDDAQSYGSTIIAGGFGGSVPLKVEHPDVDGLNNALTTSVSGTYRFHELGPLKVKEVITGQTNGGTTLGNASIGLGSLWLYNQAGSPFIDFQNSACQLTYSVGADLLFFSGAATYSVDGNFYPLTDATAYLGNAGNGWVNVGLSAAGKVSWGADAVNWQASTTKLLAKAPGGLGYGSGTVATASQASSKSQGVTANAPVVEVTMNNASLASGATVGFTLTNSVIAATDFIVPNIISGATANSYQVQIGARAAGSCRIELRNTTAGPLSEAVVIGIGIIKAS